MLLKNIRYLLLLAFCLTTVACSSRPQVLLFRRYLSDQQVAQISENLEQAGLQIVANKLAFPSDIEQSTLIYSPMLVKQTAINLTLEVINKLGWEVYSVSPLASQNHRFTQNSLGLYLVPAGQLVHKQLLENEFHSRDCQVKAKIIFHQDNRYSIVVANTPDEPVLQNQLHGTWRVKSESYLELRPTDADWFFYFEISQKLESDQVGEIEMTEMTPLDRYSLFPDCHFVAGTRR